MALTNRQIIELLTTNAGMSDAELVRVMEVNGISPAQMASAVGVTEGQIAARVGASIPPNEAILLGDTYVQAKNQVIGSGQDQQIGGLENVITYKVVDNKVGGDVNFYSPTGEFLQTTKQQEVNATKDFLKFAAGSALLFGGIGGGFDGLFSGGTGAGSSFEALNAGATAMTDLGAFELANAGATALTDLGAFELANAGASAMTDLGAFELANAGASAFTPTYIPPVDGLLTPPVVTAPVVTPPVVTPPAVTPPVVTPPVVTPPTVIPPISSVIPPLLTTTAGLLQQETSREAAVKAQQMIDAETAAAKQAAMFRPIGMTTRFGTSNFGFDPVTGQLTSAGYTLSPEAKNAQDRFVKLAESGLQQAEGAEALFSPLKTGAASLFSLGQGYLAKSPEEVASEYLKGQMSLLQPGREMELANLQNKLFQQGRSGVAVAQGGTYGDTTPELQALFNARARQEAELAAGAQRAGQQDVLFGAGLLGQGSTALGNYYAGQTAAYSPYKTAMGEVQNLETLGQQPLTMGIGLGEKAAQAGYNVGRLGLQGAGQSVELATGRAATTNPYSTAISGLASNPAFTSAVDKFVAGLFT